MNQIKTLIIHPADSTTDFLCPIYAGIPNKTVITGGLTIEEVKAKISQADSLICCGHGSPWGLFSSGQFMAKEYIIDDSHADLLKLKTRTIYIWCFADMFVQHHKINGFYTGMFVSSMEEAEYWMDDSATQELIDESNDSFGQILSQHIMEEPSVRFDNVMEQYGLVAEKNPVAQYNKQQLYFR